MSYILRLINCGKGRGFVFSFEAAISLLLFALILVSLPYQAPSSLKELAITEQASDLLRVWSAKETNEQEMALDAKLMFEQSVEIWVNAKQILPAQKKNNSIATEGIILDSALNENKIRLIIYYD